MNRLLLALAMAGLLAGAGCEPEKTPPPPVRPVLSTIVSPGNDRQVGFAGTIQPRYQVDRGFRVLGRLVARNVEVGEIVKAGQILAQIDPLLLDLAVRSAEADLAKTQSQLSNAAAAEDRAQKLLGRQVATEADFDTARQGRQAAEASVQEAQANLAKAREQRGYATLTADINGVVTSIAAEVGQTVSPGQTVMSLARTDIREAVIDLPEDVTRSLASGAAFDVRLQADPTVTTTGKVREIAPQADAATRTRRVRITLDKVVDAFRLGATITITPFMATAAADLEIPASALLEHDGGTRVWLIDTAARTVETVPVEVAGKDGANVRISSGLAAGARVVVAGVNSLSEGQAVSLDDEVAP